MKGTWIQSVSLESDRVSISYLITLLDSGHDDGTRRSALTRRHDGCVQQDPVHCQGHGEWILCERPVWFHLFWLNPSHLTPIPSTDSVNVNETVVQPASRVVLNFPVSLPSDADAFYRNPFRELDVASFPLDFQRRLKEFPFLTQIAILKNPELQKRFFPEYCS